MDCSFLGWHTLMDYLRLAILVRMLRFARLRSSGTMRSITSLWQKARSATRTMPPSEPRSIGRDMLVVCLTAGFCARTLGRFVVGEESSRSPLPSCVIGGIEHKDSGSGDE